MSILGPSLLEQNYTEVCSMKGLGRKNGKDKHLNMLYRRVNFVGPIWYFFGHNITFKGIELSKHNSLKAIPILHWSLKNR